MSSAPSAAPAPAPDVIGADAPPPASVPETNAEEEALISKHASAALAAGARLASLDMAQELWSDAATEALANRRRIEAEVTAEWEALGKPPEVAPEGPPEASPEVSPEGKTKKLAKKGDKKASSRGAAGKGGASPGKRISPAKASGGSPPLGTPKGSAKARAASKNK